MKKRIITLALAVVLAGALLISASAASFDYLADDLNALGLFRGTNSGYELDRAPNRGEALVMLIRLYGLEEEAQACESGHPFADVTAEWLTPYVAYAYENGLTTGTSATSFAPDSLCNAQMYVTFVLRALGYSDAPGGDFEYAQALDFGEDAGIIDAYIEEGVFLRDQMVAVSYLALLAEPKDGGYNTLLEKLVAEGAVTEAAAAEFYAKLELLSEFMSIGSELIGETSRSMVIKAAVDAGLMGSMAVDIDMSYALDDADFLLAADMVQESNIMGIKRSTSMSVYLADGVLYTDSEDGKFRSDEGIGDIGGMFASAGETAQTGAAPYIFSDIKKETQGGYTVYTAKIPNGLLASIMDAAMSLASGADLGDVGAGGFDLSIVSDMDISVSSAEFSYYTDQDGALRRVVMEIRMTAIGDMGGLKLPVTIKISLDMEVIAYGDAVEIVFPDDLDTYVDPNDEVPEDPAA